MSQNPDVRWRQRFQSLNPRHGLSEKTIAAIARVLERFPGVETALLFGSRAKGTHRHGSDIDLALVGPSLGWRTVGRIYDALDDLLLPHRFSLTVYDENTDSDIAAHIERVGILLFEREPSLDNSIPRKTG
jgi:predicted nucleotidyltransferase